MLNKTNKILKNYSEYKECHDKQINKRYKEILKNKKKNYWDKCHIEKLIDTGNKNDNESDDNISN